jgi:hypothetical protein
LHAKLRVRRARQQQAAAKNKKFHQKAVKGDIV